MYTGQAYIVLKKAQGMIREFINKYYDYLFALLLIVLPFGKALPNIALSLLLIFFIAGYKEVQFKRLTTIPVLLLYTFLAYIFIKGAIDQTLFTEWHMYKKLMILFIMPVLFLKVKKLDIIKIGAVGGVIASIIATLFLVAGYYAEHNQLPFGTGEAVNTLLLLERPYAGFYAVAGAIFSFGLIKPYPKYKAFLTATGIASVLFIIVISARISFLTLIAIGAVYVIFYLRVSRAKKAVVIGASIIGIVLIFMFNKNISDRFFIKDNLKESIAIASDYEPRLIIWPCAYDMTSKADFNALFGFTGNTVIEDYFVECYISKIHNNEAKREYYRESGFNSHNQFIDIYLNHGIIGFILFIAFLAILFYKVRNSFTDVALIMAIVFFLMVENVLHRQMGCYIFSTFIALLLMRKNTIDEKD